MITLKRRIMNEILTTFLPSLLILVMCYMTNFFKPFFFEAIVTVNLTAQLVLTTLFISVSGKNNNSFTDLPPPHPGDQGQFEFEPNRPLVPVLVLHGKYWSDSIVCRLGFNFDDPTRLFTVPGLINLPNYPPPSSHSIHI